MIGDRIACQYLHRGPGRNDFQQSEQYPSAKHTHEKLHVLTWEHGPHDLVRFRLLYRSLRSTEVDKTYTARTYVMVLRIETSLHYNQFKRIFMLILEFVLTVNVFVSPRSSITVRDSIAFRRKLIKYAIDSFTHIPASRRCECVHEFSQCVLYDWLISRTTPPSAEVASVMFATRFRCVIASFRVAFLLPSISGYPLWKAYIVMLDASLERLRFT